MSENSYDKNNTFEINEILNTKKQSTLEDLFDKKYLIEAVTEVFDGVAVKLDDSKPYVEQVTKHCKDTGKYVNNKTYQEKEKEIKKAFFQKISKLKKEELQKEKYYNFFEQIQKKLSV